MHGGVTIDEAVAVVIVVKRSDGVGNGGSIELLMGMLRTTEITRCDGRRPKAAKPRNHSLFARTRY